MPQDNTVLKAASILLLSCLSYNALAEQNAGLKILHYGIYAHTPDNGTTWINPVSDKAINSTSASPVHLQSTRAIPARAPLFFGFEYQISGLNEKTIKLDFDVTHPEIKQKDGTISSHYKESSTFLVIDKKVTAIKGYLLENENELEKGKWVFDVKRQGKTIASQHFTVN
ncbi:MAG: DUF3859 domain-containing protein [Gammaproteobacteria bacterium]|nr:DUF3859 domain-containing protein [Gammaproteobacteria bacterium]